MRPDPAPRKSLGAVLAAFPALAVVGPAPADTVITGLTMDSRGVLPGDLYAAVPGARFHGARFAPAAVEAGAAAILTDEAGLAELDAVGGAIVPVILTEAVRGLLGPLGDWIYDAPSRSMRVFGTTGTNGKTTVSYLLESIMRAAGATTGVIGTVALEIAGVVVPSSRTTPEAPQLQSLLAAMRGRGVGACLMEVSSHSLVFGRVDGTWFDVVGFTNLTEDHLDFHRDLADYFEAKARLFDPRRARTGVVVVDDEWGVRLAETTTLPVTTLDTGFGAGADADSTAAWTVSAVSPSPDRGGTDFTLRGPEGIALDLHVPIPGSFNVSNGALAVVMALAAGVAPDVAAAGLAACRGVPGRMERLTQPGGTDPLVVVDYAHTPDAVDRAARSLREATTGRLVVVLGAGGDRDTAKRPLMGAAAAAVADCVVVTDDNPRSEDPATIRAAVLAGAREAALPTTEVRETADRRAAITWAVTGAAAGDTILIAGKGHESGQDYAGVITPFDDRAVGREALAARRTAGAAASASPTGPSTTSGTGGAS